jgi:serralysin
VSKVAVLNSAFGVAPIDFRTINFANLFTGSVVVANASSFVIDFGAGNRSEFIGTGITYNSFGEPSGGTLTGYREFASGSLILDFSGASASVASFVAAVKNGDNIGGLFLVLAGNDVLNGTAFPDFIAGGGGGDVLNGFGGDDTLIGNSGDDTLNGGGGIDTTTYGALSSQFEVAKRGAAWIVTDKTGGFGVDVLNDMERISFTDRTYNLQLSDAITAAAEANILRQSVGLDVLVANGAVTRAAANASINNAADATTSVATLAYQFFTGKIPSAAGMDYLVSPNGPNPNNLNSPYYQSFSLENRYINFAVNLGKLGEGKDAFAAAFGSKTLAQATSDAYAKIFGSTPSAAKVSALLEPSFVLNGQTLTRAEYFAFYGQDGLNGIGTKAAMVGWLLGEAVKADVGTYAKSNNAFLSDLADGATFSIDLVGAYGKPEFAFIG